MRLLPCVVTFLVVVSSLVTCLYPRHVYNKYLKKDIAVPCGKCSACNSLKSSTWSNRLEMESKLHRFTLFITLTYGTDKVPFDYVDDLTDDDGSLESAIIQSSEYLRINDGKVYHHSVAHIQNFMKRLRINLIRNLNLSYEEGQIRYFFAFEYGPSGFRPHYHALLWFDSDKIAKSIKEYIFKAWKPNTSLQTFREFARINKMSFVRTSCSSYVAGYLNTDSNIPAILRHKLYRQKHLQSSFPPIGSLFVQQKQIREFFFGNAIKIGFVRPSNGRFVTMSLWRGLESRYFPKCPKFDALTSIQRVAMYRFSSTYGLETDYKTFKSRFFCEWKERFQNMDTSISFKVSFFEPFQMWSLYYKVFCSPDEDSTSDPSESLVQRWFYASRRVRQICDQFGIGTYSYVQCVERYYSRKNYDSLITQLKFEEDYYNSDYRFDGFSKLPYLIDPLFYENVRNLPPATYDLYLSQFGVTNEVLSVPETSLLWRSKKCFYDKIRNENTKTRVHKEFVALHPEYMNIYKQNFYYAIIS